jgi:hypothetical protein
MTFTNYSQNVFSLKFFAFVYNFIYQKGSPLPDGRGDGFISFPLLFPFFLFSLPSSFY